MAAFVLGCVTTGDDVVRVTSLQGADSGGLKPQERAQIEELKRTRAESNMNPGLNAEIEKTPHYSIEEYLAKHPNALGSAVGQDYRVGGYDVLNIIVYEEKDLSRQAVRVSADGFITFPLVGRLHVDNRTPSEIEMLISRKLAEEQYLLDAHVSVMVTDYRSKQYLVLGAVNNPGSHALQAQERVLDALSKAGGLRTEKVGKRAMVIRAENPNTAREQKIVINIDLQGLLKGKDQVSNIHLLDKDVLFIPAAEYFFIMGQVKSPGSYAIPEKEITLVEAISLAGGFTPIAARNRTRILRMEEGVEKIIHVKVDAITTEGMKIKDVVIQPNDVIIVPESFF
jgi:polysaccharide export outer membrane protein